MPLAAFLVIALLPAAWFYTIYELIFLLCPRREQLSGYAAVSGKLIAVSNGNV